WATGVFALTSSRSTSDLFGRDPAEHERGSEPAGVAAGRPAAGVDSGRVEPLDRGPHLVEHTGPLVDHETADRVGDRGRDVNRNATVVALLDGPAGRAGALDNLGDCSVRRLTPEVARIDDEPGSPAAAG